MRFEMIAASRRVATRREEANASALYAERAPVGFQLILDPDLLIEIVPAVKHGLDRLLLVDFARKEARDRLYSNANVKNVRL